jgi:putative transposase
MSSISFRKGRRVRFRDKEHVFDHALSLEQVVILDPESGEKCVAPIAELLPVESKEAAKKNADQYSAEDLAEADSRLKVIKPLLDHPRKEDRMYEAIAKSAGISVATLYRWRSKYIAAGHMTSLIQKRRGVKKGTRLLPRQVEQIVEEVIQDKYLCANPSRATALAEEVLARIAERGLGIKAPHINTLRSRLRGISEQKRVEGQEGANAADQKFTPNLKSLIADFPLEIAQVDHTLIKVEIVTGDVLRLPIGPAWITVVFDVYSRMVLGVYITLEAPSAHSVGQAVINAILPKEHWLKSLGIEAPWPVWGKPTRVHADNGSDFRSETIEKSCKLHSIDIQWRPVRKPNWGGHIEAYMKTLGRMLRELPGAIVRDGKGRRLKGSRYAAALTLRELETYLIRNIVGRYHQMKHSGIGNMTPIERWRQGLLRPTRGLGLGLPDRIQNEDDLKIDFLRGFDRIIGPDGVQIGNVEYFDPILSAHVDERVPGRPRLKRKFVFRRNDRDIKFIYFWDEKAAQYYRIPSSDLTMPPASVWEWRKAEEESRKSIGHVDQRLVVQTLLKNRELVRNSVEKTKRARRDAARLANDERERGQPRAVPLPEAKALSQSDLEITPFDDVQSAG